MIVSWNWLTQYVRLDMSVEALAERLALTGLNHESTEDVGGDLAIDLEVTSNRPDCLGHLGVAREIGVLFGKGLCIPEPRLEASGPAVETVAGVAIEAPDLCSRFTARVVSGVTVRESPWWLRKRLETLGVRPISNVVDVTNYVMFECGQPLHAYDLDALEGRRLIVRRAVAKETLKAINGKVYDLTPEMLVIADASRPVGLAGVMGGLDTEIGPGTKNVLIEAARFDPMSIRKTARALGLFSPSSYRFERPIDPEITEWASRRCAELILETSGGTLHPGVIDLGPTAPARPPITLRLAQIPRVLGIDVARPEVERILKALGLEVNGSDAASITVTPPSWRSDLEREIDLIEEVARVHGYEHIPVDRAVPLTSALRGDRERVEGIVRQTLSACGFDEAVTFSLVADPLAIPIAPGEPVAPVRVEHSSRRREASLRQSLVPSLLAARRHNEAHGNPAADLYEIADVYLPRAGKAIPDQPARLALVSGQDFFGLKGVIEAVAARLHVEKPLTFKPMDLSFFVPGASASIEVGGEHLGYLGVVAKGPLDVADLRISTTAAELELSTLRAWAVLVPQNRTLPPFPAVERDLTLDVAADLPWADLAEQVRSTAGPTLESVDFLDTYQGKGVREGRQNIHFGLRYRHPERTLTGNEVADSVGAIIQACRQGLGAIHGSDKLP